MTLVKSKINSLAWLKSAIYISVVGGVILSSKSASAFTFTFDDKLGNAVINARENFREDEEDKPINGTYWKGNLFVKQEDGSSDKLRVSGSLYHIGKPHPPGDDDLSQVFKFNFFIDPDGKIGNLITAPNQGNTLKHFGSSNHSDTYLAELSADFSSTLNIENLTRWDFTLTATHNSAPVPEPTTIFGSALALGVGGWLKRKKSSQQDKTAPQR